MPPTKRSPGLLRLVRPHASRAFDAAMGSVALLLLAPALGGQQQQNAPTSAPRAIAPDPVWDAGIVARGAKVRHEFVLENAGVAMLQIREVRPDCGCTVASFDAAIPPGGEGKVRAELDTQAMPAGAIAKGLTVFTNDVANPMIQLTIRAQVRAALDAQPGYFRFIHTHGAPAETASQVVWSADQAALQVTSVASSLPSFTVNFRPAGPGEREAQGKGQQWVIVGTLAAEPPTGPLMGEVTVETNHPRQPVLHIPVTGYVHPLVAVTPPTADFGSFSGGEPRLASVLIKNNGQSPLRLLAVDTDVRGLSARIEEREKGKRFDVALTLAAGAPKGPFAGMLRVRTDSTRVPLLEVPVKGEVR
jgi:hypothetical protein